MFLRRLVIACAALMLSGAGAREASLEDKVAALYRPFQADMVTLAPDGRHVAYTRHARGQLAVIIMDIQNPTVKTTILVDEDRPVAFSREKETARLRYLRWITPNRLVMAPTEEIVELPGDAGTRILAPILATDADGKNAKKLIDADDFSIMLDLAPPGAEEPQFQDLMRHINVVGRLPGDPDHFLVEALGAPAPRRHLGPLPTSLHKVNVNTGKIATLTEEFDLGNYLYDWDGRARVLYERGEHSLTREFLHLRPSGGGRWRRTSDTAAGSLPKAFTLSTANYFGERSAPLGFDFDPKVLIFASNTGRDTFGVYGLNVETRERTELAVEHPHFDLVGLEPEFPSPALVFDETRRRLAGVRTTGVTPLTLWVDPELAGVQRDLEKKFPRRTVEILEWDDARWNFLLRVTGGSEPGRYFIFQKPEKALLEFLRRAPWLKTADLHDSAPFEFDTPAGVHLTGYLTFPRAPRIHPPPLLVYLPAGFPSRAQPEFDREAQILAGMGFVVARVNHRGATGFGAKHRDAIHAGVDRIPVADILATIEWVAGRHPVDRRRVATMGEGFGGYLALRALQLAPNAFRCAIAINAPLDLALALREPLADDIMAEQKVDFPREVQRAFFQRNATKLAETSVLRQPELLTKPVFLIVDPHNFRELGIENNRLRSQLKRLDRAPEFLELKSNDFALGLPAARARVFKQIGEFFNLNLYDYRVDVGEAKEKK